jgi:hypothetical protein
VLALNSSAAELPTPIFSPLSHSGRIECKHKKITRKRKKRRKKYEAVRTTPHINYRKGTTLEPSTVKLLHCKKGKEKSMGIRRVAGLA